MDRAEQAESAQHEALRRAIREALDEVQYDGAVQQRSAALAGQSAEDAVAQWTAEERRRLAHVSKALHHWARRVLKTAFHDWLSRTDPMRERSAAATARQAVAASGLLDGWMHDDEAVLERPSAATLNGPGHYVRVGYLPGHADLAGARLRGRAEAVIRGVNDGPLPLGRQHAGRLHTIVTPPNAFPANSGLSGLPGPPWGAPSWATQPEHGMPVHFAQNAWGVPIEQYPVPQVNLVQQAVPVVQPPLAHAPSPPPEQSDGKRSLGNGWEERQTAEGRLYYAHHPTRTTRFEKPSAEELGQVVKVVDPLANLREIREQKARLQMRADELRWQGEVQRQESLAQACRTHLAAADDVLRQPKAAVGRGYDEVLGLGRRCTPNQERTRAEDGYKQDMGDDEYVPVEGTRPWRPELPAGHDGYSSFSVNHEEQENVVPRRRGQGQERAEDSGGSGRNTRGGRAPLSPLHVGTTSAHAADSGHAAAMGTGPSTRVLARYAGGLPAANARPVRNRRHFPIPYRH